MAAMLHRYVSLRQDASDVQDYERIAMLWALSLKAIPS